ncbi:beta-alanine-activating enzyme isoform X2 [Panulirus ornatus]|uniref:beta-alanine-activating enzyme isoform X2 n=1 Tax=Panulirus ornatus TaxID=150431 RepID=UPI003A85C20F
MPYSSTRPFNADVNSGITITNSTMARNLCTIFHTEAAKHPDNLAIVYCEDIHCQRKITYSELQREATEIAKVLSLSKTCDAHFSVLKTVAGDKKQQEQHCHIIDEESMPESLFTEKQSIVCENLKSKNVDNMTSTVIGILCSPGPTAIACILGVLANNAYLYITPEYSRGELASIVKRIYMKSVLVEEKYLENVAEMVDVVLCSLYVFGTHFKLVSLHSEKESEFQRSNEMKDVAYVIPTSGSTGIPKYVYVPHLCIIPNIIDLVKLFEVGQEDCIFCAAPLTFDPSVVDLFLAFKAGARLVMVSPYLLKIPVLLLDIVLQNRVTILQATPTLLLSFGKERLKESFLGNNSSLKVLALGGEMFPKLSHLKQLVGEMCQTRIFNLYGITEVSCWATVAEVIISELVTDTEDSPPKTVSGEGMSDGFSERKVPLLGHSLKDMTPIGNSLSFTKVKVLSKSGEDVRDGEEGEIYIGGPERMCRVDDGTVNLDARFSATENRQAPSFFRPSGDRGVLKGGKIYFIGRLDCQVKRNGRKISLSEITRVCRNFNYVETCHVALHNEKQIIAFVYPHYEYVTEEDVWKDLRNNLSHWKLPDDVIIVKELPFNKHGKVDIQKLMTARQVSSVNRSDKYKLQSLDKFYRDLWKRILGCNNASPHDNFVKSGGNSLKAIQFTEELENFLGYSIPNLLDVLLSETLLKTYQLAKKYYSRNSFENVDIFHPKPSKIFKSENIRMLDSHFQTNAHGDYHTQNIIPSSYSEGICQEYDSLNKEEAPVKDGNLKLTVVSRRGILNKGTSPIHYKSIPYKIGLLWKYNLKKCIDSSPMIIEYGNGTSFAFVGSHSHKFACINAVTGTEHWCLQLGGRIESSPIISKNGAHVYIGCYDGLLYCICIESGQIIWKFTTGAEIKSSPIVDDEMGFVIFGSHDKILYCVTADGELTWKVSFSNGSIFSSPCISGNTVFVASLDGIVGGIDKNTGKIIWRRSVNKPVFSSLASYSRGIIFANVCKKIFSYSFSGSRLWKFETKGNVFSSPFVLQLENGMEVIGIGSHDNCVYFLNSYGEKIVEYNGLSPIYASPYLYCLNDQNAFRAVICETSGRFCIVHVMLNAKVDPEKSDSSTRSSNAVIETILERKLNGELFASPVFFKNRLYIGSRDDFLYGFYLHS